MKTADEYYKMTTVSIQITVDLSDTNTLRDYIHIQNITRPHTGKLISTREGMYQIFKNFVENEAKPCVRESKTPV